MLEKFDTTLDRNEIYSGQIQVIIQLINLKLSALSLLLPTGEESSSLKLTIADFKVKQPARPLLKRTTYTAEISSGKGICRN